MSFIRPEARAAVARWREALAGGAVLALGLWWALGSLGLIRWLGVVLVLLGAGLAWTGVQRARFRGGHGGLGVVHVDERQVTYLAPVGGGFASLDALVQVEVAPDLAGLPVWRFTSPGEVLVIPVNAEGTDALFEALSALPGVDMQAAIRASASRPETPILVWQAPRMRLH